MDARRRVLDERTLLLRLDDLWFEVKLAELPVRREVVSVAGSRQQEKIIAELRYGIVIRRETSLAHADSTQRRRLYGSSNLYAASKRQLSQREIKAHQLRE